MKIYFTLALFTVLLLSCKEEVNSPSNEVQLESIVSEFLGRDASILFEYDTLDRLARVEDHYEGKQIEYSYSNNKLDKILTYDSLGILKSLDSVTYHQNGQIDRSYWYFIDENAHLKASIIYEYVYNSDDLVERVNSINSSGAIIQYKTYAWFNGNISQINEYSGNDHLFFENSFEYDQKLNYKKYSPYFYFDPQNTTNNNVIKANVKDHTGLYDGSPCNPCLLFYVYNNDGYPTSYKYENGSDHFINYR